MGSVCINLHQKSAIRARVGFIDPHLLPRRMVSRLTFRSTCAAVWTVSFREPRGPAYRFSQMCMWRGNFCTCARLPDFRIPLRGGSPPLGPPRA